MHGDGDNKPFETGLQVWKSLVSQFEEGRGFFYGLILSIRTFLKKYLLSFLIFAIIGGAVAFGIKWVLPDTYKASMTVSYTHYEKKIYADMLAKLNELVKEDEYENLGKLLKLDTKKASQIKAINSSNIKREPLVDDLSTEKIPFYVEVEVKDQSILPELQVALLNYLNGTEFIEERRKFTLEKAKEELAFYQNRLHIIDSLSRSFNTKLELDEEKSQVTRMDLLEETQAVYSKIQEVKGTIAFNENIEVLDGFIPSGRPAGKPLSIWLMYGMLGGIGLRLFAIVFLNY